MPRLGKSQTGRHRLGGSVGITLTRTSTGYVSTIEADSARTVAYLKTLVSWTDTIGAEASVSRASLRTSVSFVDTTEAEAQGIGSYNRSTGNFTKTAESESERSATFFKTATGWTSVVEGESSAISSVLRESASFINTLEGELLSTASYDRSTTTFADSGESQSNRSTTYSKTATGWIDTIEGDASSIGLFIRAGGSFMEPVERQAERDTSYSRTPEIFTETVEAESVRGIGYGRTSTTYIPVPFEGSVSPGDRLGGSRLGNYRLGEGNGGEPGRETGGGRLGSSRLGNYRLGGGITETVKTGGGIVTDADREVSYIRIPVNYSVNIIEDAGITVTSETYVESVFAESDESVPYWRFNGLQIRELIEEVREWDRLQISFIANRKMVTERIRPLLDRSGKVDVVERVDGGFETVDRSGGANEVDGLAPSEREDVRSVDTWYVNGYEESIIDSDGEQWEVEIELIPDREKAYDNEYGTLDEEFREVRSEGYWKFSFDFSDVVTRRVTTNVDRLPDGTVTGAEMELVLTQDQVRRLEESAGKLAATNFREVPDGLDLVEDTSNGDRNTVTITPPTDGNETLTEGDYIIDSFETEYNRGAHVVSLSIKQT